MDEINSKINLKKSFFKELFDFLKEYSVIGLAIGVIVAQISKDLIDSIVAGILTPFIKIIIPSQGIQTLSFSLRGVVFNFGIILNNLLTFLIILTILFIIIKKILKKDSWLSKKK